VPDADALESLIGPPLEQSFREHFGMTPADARQAVADYREYFSEKGLYENAVYPGIAELLANLRGRDLRLAVATSKPTVFAERILTHFGLASHFDGVVGSHLDGGRVDKQELIADALAALNVDAHDAVHVGDRRHDVIGARANGVTAIAVGWGYGTREELLAAEPHELVESVSALGRLLLL
jgi:phosphoglycolate phosphatase